MENEIILNEEKIKELVNEKVKEVAMDIFAKSQENLVTPDENGRIISDTSELLTSGEVVQEGEEWIVRYNCPHSSYVEYGISPTSIPVEPLIKWAKRKLRKTDEEAEGIGWAIRTKIAKEGLPPRLFLKSAIYEIVEKLK
ncbi:MAG: hypothetical protein KAW47_11110 [Thermoplasmatales archaeon]|nr:hypothetical protein [Thermoplasmatales archaeon]